MKAPKSICRICEKEYAKAGMSRHLATHLKKHATGKPTQVALHIQVFNGPYFLHLLTPATTSFEQLDRFLRQIWLECCGHMSAFMLSGGYGEENEISMNTKLGRWLQKGSGLEYIYDWGSSTHLAIKCMGEYAIKLPKNEILILARNAPFDFKCQACGKSADCICGECAYQIENPFYCEDCGENEDKHGCGEEMLCSISNSPRMGACAYEGEMDEDKFTVVKLP